MAFEGTSGLGLILKLSSFTLGRQLIANLCQLGLVLLLARVLGPEQNGQFVVALLLPMLLVNLLNLGVPSANVYFLARKNVSLTDALESNIWFWVFSTVVGFAGSVISIAFFSEILFPGVPKFLLWGASVIFPVSLLYVLLVSLLQGKQDFKSYNIVMIVPSVASFVLAIVLVWGMGSGVGGALLAWGIGQIAGLILLVRFLLPLYSGSGRGYKISEYMWHCLSYGWKANLSNIVTFLNYRSDIFLVNLLINPSAAGLYVVSVRISEGLWLLSQAVSPILLPKLSEMHRNEDLRKWITPVVARWVTYVGLVLSIILAAVADSLVAGLFGMEYGESVQVLLWLLPGVILFNTARILASDIAARGRPDLNMWTSFITFFVNVVGNIILIPKYGISGAAAATTMAYILATTVDLVIYSRLSANPWWSPILPGRDDWVLFKQLSAKVSKLW